MERRNRRERILHERTAGRTFLSPTFATIQLKRLPKKVRGTRENCYSHEVSLFRRLRKRRRRRRKKRKYFLVVIVVLFSSLSSYAYLVNGNCLSTNRWTEHSSRILYRRDFFSKRLLMLSILQFFSSGLFVLRIEENFRSRSSVVSFLFYALARIFKDELWT